VSRGGGTYCFLKFIKARQILGSLVKLFGFAIFFLQKHWSTYVVEDDFRFLSSSGLNAVRIPVGWWIASDPNPPAPYVGGSLQALDNAFKWAE
jgi:hypothetical protein